MLQPSVFNGVQRLLFARLQTHQTLPQAFPRQQLSQLHATCSSHLFLRAFKAAVRPPSNPPNPPAGLSKATTLAATCYMLQPSAFKGVQACRLLAFKPPKPSRRPFQGNNSRSYSPSQLSLTAFKAAVCPPSNPSKPLRRPFQGNKLSQLHATCSSQLSLTAFKAAVCPPSNPSNPSAGLSKATTLAATCYMLQPSVFKGVQGCRLPAFQRSKPSKPSRMPFQGNSSLPFARFKTVQTSKPRNLPASLSNKSL